MRQLNSRSMTSPNSCHIKFSQLLTIHEMWKAIQEQIQSVPTQSVEDDNSLMRYNDLVQENGILRQELADLYEHLTIVDDTSEGNQEDSRASAMGRLIISNKTKHDTEMLMKHEELRQKLVLLEKELSYQNSHMKEQASKIKDLEGKLKVAQAKLLTSDAESMGVVSLRQKIQELSAHLATQAHELHIAAKRNGELEEQMQRDAGILEVTESEMHRWKQQVFELREQLGNTSIEMKNLSEVNSRLANDNTTTSKKLDDQQILLMKQEVDLMTIQTENKHLERKVEAQSKELLKLYESVSNLRATVTQRELELAQDRDKASGRCTGLTDEEEMEGAASPLMRGRGNVSTTGNRVGGRGVSSRSESVTGRANKSTITSTATGTGGSLSGGRAASQQRPYHKLSSSERSDEADNSSRSTRRSRVKSSTIGSTSSIDGGRRVEKDTNIIGDQPLLFGDDPEDCLCTFFPK